MYKCAVCGESVVRAPDGKLERKCDHKDAAIVADMASTLAGKSSLK
jgi:hypothetical protein